MKKKIAKGFLFLLGLVLVAFLSIVAYHHICLAFEENKIIPIGEMVEVNGHNIHVYVEGNGDDTLVFLSGAGTPSPALNFKPLYELLSDEYKIAIVERAGYGFSEPVTDSRDIDIVMEETRTALQLAGVEAPYILVPHSMAGIEAIYWAQIYQSEVKAIIGLDAAVPEDYIQLDEGLLEANTKQSRILAGVLRIGIIRFMPELDHDSTMEMLSEQEKYMYSALTMRNFMNGSVIQEGAAIRSNAVKVNENELPNIPLYYFVSNGEV